MKKNQAHGKNVSKLLMKFAKDKIDQTEAKTLAHMPVFVILHYVCVGRAYT